MLGMSGNVYNVGSKQQRSNELKHQHQHHLLLRLQSPALPYHRCWSWVFPKHMSSHLSLPAVCLCFQRHLCWLKGMKWGMLKRGKEGGGLRCVGIEQVGLFLTGAMTTSAAHVGRKEVTNSSDVQGHPENVSLNLLCLLPSQYKLVTFNLCKHTPEVSCQTQKGRKGGRCKTSELAVD